MSQILANLNSIAGLVSIIAVFAVSFLSARAMSKSKISEEAHNAQQRAIEAMQGEIASLRRKIDDTKQDNVRLRRTIDTIRIALEKRGLNITISEDAIDIEDNKKSTTIRIHSEDA